MGWHLLETLLQQVGENSTLVGKLWVTATFVFRFIIVASVGDAVYSDEQSDFNCNTEQPGCENVCFNKFSPISHLRFWAAQIIAVCTPSIVFVVYSAHMLLKIPEQEDSQDFDEEELPFPDEEIRQSEQRQEDEGLKRSKMGRRPSVRSLKSHRSAKPRTEEIGMVRGFANPPDEKVTRAIENIKEEDRDDGEGGKADGLYNDQGRLLSDINSELAMLEKMSEGEGKRKRIKKRIQFVYAIALLLRTGFEGVFLWLQYELYGFTVPETYQCRRDPCPHTVDCFVSRPQEKTIFLWFMLAVSALCLLLNIVEIKYLGIKKLFQVLCAGGKQAAMDNAESGDKIDGKRLSLDRSGSKESSCSYLKIDRKPSPAPGFGKKKRLGKDEDYDTIGFGAIGNQPHHAAPGFPHVHRYGMLLNAAPPHLHHPPSDAEKSYL